MATDALAVWRVRLAAVRIDRCIRLGVEPRRDDVAMLGLVVGESAPASR